MAKATVGGTRCRQPMERSSGDHCARHLGQKNALHSAYKTLESRAETSSDILDQFPGEMDDWDPWGTKTKCTDPWVADEPLKLEDPPKSTGKEPALSTSESIEKLEKYHRLLSLTRWLRQIMTEWFWQHDRCDNHEAHAIYATSDIYLIQRAVWDQLDMGIRLLASIGSVSRHLSPLFEASENLSEDDILEALESVRTLQIVEKGSPESEHQGKNDYMAKVQW
ncbi:hypothetical protein GGR57DRAFT_516342 [Xylariaceae sp. FL1272]|nr:hypothetical protein GGR57DRAFT_516342 [Xylariaceae sp. FL1272]